MLMKMCHFISAFMTTPSDLKKLPIITKEDVRKSYDDLISRERIKSKIRYTSGTTVTPLKVKVSSDAIMINRAASMLRDHWAGYEGDRVARFVGDHPVTNCMDRCLHRRSYVMNRLIYPPNCLSINNSREVLKSLRDKKIAILQCYPSAGYILAKFLEKYDEYLPLKAILYSSEPLHSYERELMEERFQTKAYGFYGQAECVFSASECEKGGYHLSMLDGILEITRGEESVEPGEYGSTVVTSLWNKAMPLIRYRLDDYTGFTNKPCSCGRTTPTIYPIESKIDDLVITPSGRIVTPLSITCPLKSAKNVLECQIVQKSIDSITLRIVPLPGFSTEDETALHGIFRSVLGEDFSLSIEKVSKIHSTTAGKKRRVINEMSGDIFERGFTEGRKGE
jgi:phenylacetate-CoA ligase